jgi:regulator of protease activity HflC (stomatin/prohibitin superfamily)
MGTFIGALAGLLLLTIIIQLITNMKIIGGNELGIVSGTNGKKGFRLVSGGRVFLIPLIHKFSKIDLTPCTIEVVVDSAIAEGIVPLNVKATVSFAVASNEAGRKAAAMRILHLANDWETLQRIASDIIEGHLRDSIATMTPEQVMQDKDTLVSKMINVCKSDLENIGLEITTMNIADVDDHRLKGVDEPDLYIALLKRVQTTNAGTKARKAKADAMAKSKEEQENRRAEIEVRKLDNQYEELVALTNLRVKEEEQKEKVGVEQVTRDAAARIAGLKAQIEAEKQRIEMLKKKYEAEIITPAQTEKERMIMHAQQDAAKIAGKAQGEIDELKETINIIKKQDKIGVKTYLIENFQQLITPFAETLGFFPVEKLSVITGAEGKHDPISAIHPNAIEDEKNKAIAAAISHVMNETKIQPGGKVGEVGKNNGEE